MNQLTNFPTPAPEPSPIKAQKTRAPYVAPQLETHPSWVLATGVSWQYDSLLSQLPGRLS